MLLMGKSTISTGPFSIATSMLVHQRVSPYYFNGVLLFYVFGTAVPKVSESVKKPKKVALQPPSAIAAPIPPLGF